MSETTTNELVIGTLNKMDIKALQQCDTVSFHRIRTGSRMDNLIAATKRLKNNGPFDDRERKHTITCTATIRVFKNDDVFASSSQDATCFACIVTAQYCEEWQSIVSILKAGDTVSLEWVGGDNNCYMNRQTEKLYHDRLFLCIKRKDKKMKFHVCNSICPNNTARMIRL